MGGVPVLLMIATMSWGITYGWQPDESGHGVEYLIQIPPGELEQLQRIGEISSSIDPAVRGRVSRIVVRVGNGPLPRTTPSNGEAIGNVASDQRPMAIPEMTESAARTLAMKPDPQGSGFSLPATLTDAANAVRGNIDQAGREISSAANDKFRGAFGATSNPPDPRAVALVAPPGTRAGSANVNTASNSGFAPPAFTSSTGSASNGPGWGNTPSTNPNGRDNSWLGSTGLNTGASGNAGPSTDPANPTYFGAAARTSADPTGASNLNANGLRPSDTFGQTPTGMTSPRGYPADPRANDLGQTAQNTIGRQAPALSQYEQMLIDRQYRNQPNSGSSSQSPTQQTLAQQTLAQQNLAQQNLAQQNLAQQKLWAEQQARINPAPGYSGTNSGSVAPSNESLGYRKATTTESDSRLTNAQLAAGAWSVDAQERVYDVNGQLMPNEFLRWNNSQPPQTTMSSAASPTQNFPGSPLQYPRNTSDPRYASASPYPSDPRYDQTAANPIDPRYAPGPAQSNQTPGYDSTNYRNTPTTEAIDPRWNSSLGYPAEDRRSTGSSAQEYPSPSGSYASNQAAIDRYERDRLIAAREEARQLAVTSIRDTSINDKRDPPSLSDRVSANLVTDSGRFESTPQVAAQPLFNGLLLISFVANVYLVFWLKNLRLQFRDMVAAKRVASANSVAS